MPSPTDNDTKLADRLAGIEGAVARRDAIAEALAAAFEAGQAHQRGAPSDRGAIRYVNLDPWDFYFASCMSGILAADTHDETEEDIKLAASVADDMLRERDKRSGKGRGR